jgi:hypothetical protein
LAEIHGGRAWVEERSGGGASFRVSLFGPKPDEGAQASTAARPSGEREMAYASGADNGSASTNGSGTLAE